MQEDIKKQNDILLKENETLKKKQGELTSSINNLKLEEDKAKETIEALGKEIVALQLKKEEEKVSENKSLLEEIEANKKGLITLRESLATVQLENEKVIDSLEDKKKNLNVEIDAIVIERQKQEEALLAVRRNIKDEWKHLHDIKNELESETKKLLKVSGSLDSAVRELGAKLKEISEADLLIVKKKKEVELLNTDVNKLSEDIVKLDKRLSINSDILAKIDESSKKLVSLESNISASKAEFEDLQSKISDIKAMQNKIDSDKLLMVDKVKTLKRAQQVIKEKYEKAGLEYVEINF